MKSTSSYETSNYRGERASSRMVNGPLCFAADILLTLILGASLAIPPTGPVEVGDRRIACSNGMPRRRKSLRFIACQTKPGLTGMRGATMAGQILPPQVRRKI